MHEYRIDDFGGKANRKEATRKVCERIILKWILEGGGKIGRPCSIHREYRIEDFSGKARRKETTRKACERIILRWILERMREYRLNSSG
jgi:hypothetical protein